MAASPDRIDVAAALKDAAIAALVALALSVFLVGVKTNSMPGGLVLSLRLEAVAVAIVAVFVGRFLLNILVWRQPASTARLKVPSLPGVGDKLGPIMLLVAVGLPIVTVIFFPDKDRQIMDLAILTLTYVMLAWGLNIVVGFAGLLDLGYVAFYAVGAYSFALLAKFLDIGFWTALPLAGILAGCWGIILGFPVLRLRGDYLAIVTLAFGEIIRVVLLNWYEFTGGPDGISGIPKPTLFGLEFKRNGGFADFFDIPFDSIQRFVFFYYIILALALVTYFVTLRLRKLPLGRAWEALREDEMACRSLGINVTNTKLSAFAIGAMFGGFAGSFFATRQGFISPESFTFIESAVILAIVVLGGLGSQLGVALAAIVLIGGFEVFRELEQYRMLVFGLAMVVIMIWRPRGLISTRVPSIFLKRKKAISADLVAQGEGH